MIMSQSFDGLYYRLDRFLFGVLEMIDIEEIDTEEFVPFIE